MDHFEFICLLLYWQFSSAYMMKTLRIEHENNIVDRIYYCFIGLTLGALLTPYYLAIDIYDKLHK